MIFKHHTAIHHASFEKATLILYALIYKENNQYHVRIINWLNWLETGIRSIGLVISLLGSETLITGFLPIRCLQTSQPNMLPL